MSSLASVLPGRDAWCGGECDGAHDLGTGGAEHPNSLCQSGPGGHHIVDQNDTLSARVSGGPESAGDIAHPLVTAQTALIGALARGAQQPGFGVVTCAASEHLDHGVSSPALGGTRGGQRHHDRIAMPAGPDGGQSLPQGARKGSSAVLFEGTDDPRRNTGEAQGADHRHAVNALM